MKVKLNQNADMSLFLTSFKKWVEIQGNHIAIKDEKQILTYHQLDMMTDNLALNLVNKSLSINEPLVVLS